jgi:dienelactone hydrolase
MHKLKQVPATETIADTVEKTIRAVFIEGEPFAGKSTKVFAYVGLPHNAQPESPVPGVVCVHGGGGTAFAEWVHIWNRHGFAAISIDTNGNKPVTSRAKPDKSRHQWAGPGPYGFDQKDAPLTDQWPYHAVAAIIRANSLLRSLPEVDSSKVGITGISWGGYLTCLASGIDPRFKFAIPVYGCGFLDEGPTWAKSINEYGHDRWVKLWDPSSYLSQSKCPMLWINGTNDRHYFLPMFQKSYRLPQGPHTLAVRIEMAHGHQSGWSPSEIYAFAKSAVGLGTPLIQITGFRTNRHVAEVTYKLASGVKLKSAELVYTTDRGNWYSRKWNSAVGRIDANGILVSADVPTDAAAYFFQLVDSRGLLISSEHVEIAPSHGYRVQGQ